jgi:hypothetical protein
MLSRTRFKEYFDVIGDFTQHFGEFEACGTAKNSGMIEKRSNQKTPVVEQII